ncbi:hypothetical protein PssB301D_02655 [Pseudomonas syringae pv. syringae str. B301D-R]|nr:hypothetical protein PssB301D_02655 [Pseudomonas syringae pv. syringae str. B301D-R]
MYRVGCIALQFQQVKVNPLNAVGQVMARQRQHLPRTAVLQHERLTFGGGVDVQRHIRRPAFDNRQLTGQQIKGALQQQCHPLARLHTEVDQVTGQRVGATVQFPVGQALVILHSSQCIRLRRHLLFEKFLQAAVAWVFACRVIEVVQHLLAFGCREDLQTLQRGLRLLLQRLYQRAECRQHVLADALCTDLRQGLNRQAEALAQVIHRQRDRVCALLLAAQTLQAFPGLERFGRSHRFAGTVTVIEQRIEQRRRCGNAAATLGLGQRRMFMTEQGRQPCMGGSDPFTHRMPFEPDPQRQGVDEHAQRPVGAVAALHPAHQHRAENHIRFARQRTHHSRPGEVMQTRGADPKLSGLGPQTRAQCVIDGQVHIFDQ